MSLLLTETEQKSIIAAIHEAESYTSGEIRVHIEHHCPQAEPVERAKEVFGQLGMHLTTLKNGVLFYVAVEDRKFAVIGDKGINDVVPADFWNQVCRILRNEFVQGKFGTGLHKGIVQAGEQLKTYFPSQNTDTNELSNDISFG